MPSATFLSPPRHSAGVIHESALARTAAFQGFQAFRGECLNEHRGGTNNAVSRLARNV
ncbi:hypothetical protein WN55_02200 [Dufourea novaeangliae]|uniref:Uncharacterized protein n=1 Tax=Dufourea novaeangliae TaxID=178035 RepID=A0A154PFS1_DUFNO|nr:hypothetical protein WN55_02200 [Dufourea novaeangliae]